MLIDCSDYNNQMEILINFATQNRYEYVKTEIVTQELFVCESQVFLSKYKSFDGYLRYTGKVS
jgi:hypothetical protein